GFVEMRGAAGVGGGPGRLGDDPEMGSASEQDAEERAARGHDRDLAGSVPGRMGRDPDPAGGGMAVCRNLHPLRVTSLSPFSSPVRPASRRAPAPRPPP